VRLRGRSGDGAEWNAHREHSDGLPVAERLSASESNSTAGNTQNGPYGAFTVQVLGGPVAAGGGPYLTTYQVDNWSGAAFGTGCYVTIFDVPGTYPRKRSPAGTCSYQLAGRGTSHTAPPDIAEAWNATGTYIGAAVGAGSAGPVTSFTFLTDFGGPQRPCLLCQRGVRLGTFERNPEQPICRSDHNGYRRDALTGKRAHARLTRARS
jgi:hypothetical protein